MRRLSLFSLAAILLTTALHAQSRVTWTLPSDIKAGATGSIVGAVLKIDAASGTADIVTDADVARTPIHVKTDTKTVFDDFGAPGESKQGAEGFALLKEGDRIEARGKGASANTVLASEIHLHGREVTAPPPPASPAPAPPRPVSAPMSDRVEGVVRSVDAAESRIVVETGENALIAVFGSEETPVNFRGSIYSIGNVEVGDRVAVRLDRPGGENAKVVAIDVLESVSHQRGGAAVAPRRPAEVRPESQPAPAADGDLEVVEIEGTITVGLDNSQTLEIREDGTGNVVTVWTDEELVVDADHPSRAGQLVEGQQVTVRAFRVGSRLVAQVISVGE